MIVNEPVDTQVSLAHLHVRKIAPADLKEVLAKGLDDFMAMPTYSIFLIVIYPVVGLILLRLTFGYALLPIVFPLIAGFALLGPFAAIGLYEMSRRREQRLVASWNALDVFQMHRIRSIAILGAVLMGVFLAWLSVAMLIYENIFGNWAPATFTEFVLQVFTTPAGYTLIVAGCGAGFLFAVVAFAISVVSFPLLVDRDAGVALAVLTSIRAVTANPVTMALWGLIVVSALVVGFLPFLIGLSIVLPVLGHSTWHLYRKVVER